MENTTNINELPIDSTPPENRQLPESQLNSSVNRVIDPNVRIDEGPKRVQFQENIKVNKNKNFELKETHKVILLASILFIFFSDSKVKAYVMNILETIFGKIFKTGDKLSLVVYSMVFGSALLACVSFIDLSSINLAF
jgi:ATP-dependent Clp protease adapter protein ClpS